MIVSQLASLRNSAGFGHRWVTDASGNEKLELVAPDLMMWSDASNVRGLLTTYMLHLFPEKMLSCSPVASTTTRLALPALTSRSSSTSWNAGSSRPSLKK